MKTAGVDETEIDRYFGIVTERSKTARCGSQWLLRSLNQMKTEDHFMPIARQLLIEKLQEF